MQLLKLLHFQIPTLQAAQDIVTQVSKEKAC